MLEGIAFIFIIIAFGIAFVFVSLYLLGWYVEKRKPQLYKAAKQRQKSKKKGK